MALQVYFELMKVNLGKRIQILSLHAVTKIPKWIVTLVWFWIIELGHKKSGLCSLHKISCSKRKLLHFLIDMMLGQPAYKNWAQFQNIKSFKNLALCHCLFTRHWDFLRLFWHFSQNLTNYWPPYLKFHNQKGAKYMIVLCA